MSYSQIIKYRKQYFVLSFEYQFEHDDDEVQFAQIPPYTYSHLINVIKPLVYNQLNDDGKNQYLIESTICKSLSGIPVSLLTITDYIDQSISLTQRKVIVITARIHPGEATGSWMCQGLIESLLGQNLEIQQIRKKVIFKIIPMMNPDGVILGNYRTGLAGLDLNRQFSDSTLANANNQLFPTVNAVKQLIKELKEQYGNNMLGLIDLHGHSNKKNIFTFGPYYPPTDFRYYRSKFIPKLIEKGSQYFRYYSCTYNSQKANKNTARVAFLNKYNLEICYTIEATFGLYYKSDTKSTQAMASKDWITFGTQLPSALKQYIEMMDTYNIIKEQEKQLNLSPLKRNPLQSPNRANSIAKIKNQQSLRDNQDPADFMPFDENQVYNLGGLLKEIQNDERQLISQQNNQEEGDSSDNYSDNSMDSEPSDEDLPNAQRAKLFSNIDNYQKNFTKFIMGKKKKEKLVIEGGEEKRDKIITHKLKRSAISVDNKEVKKKKGKKKKKDDSAMLQSENAITFDAGEIQKSMKRLDKIRMSTKALGQERERRNSQVSILPQNQGSQHYLEEDEGIYTNNDELGEGASNMFLADLKKKKKARIRMKISNNNSMITNNENQNYHPEQNLRSSFNEDEEDDQLNQYRMLHLARKYNSNMPGDQKYQSPNQFRENDNLYNQYYDGADQQHMNQDQDQIFQNQFKSNLPHYYKRIPKNRVPMKLNIICDKFQTSSKPQQHFTPNAFIQQSNPFSSEQSDQFQDQQRANYYNIQINQSNPFSQRYPQNSNHNSINNSGNINEDDSYLPPQNFKSKAHENLYNQIIQSAMKQNITHKNDSKTYQLNFDGQSPMKVPYELKLPMIDNKQGGRAMNSTQANISNRNNRTLNIYQMPIMEQVGNDLLDVDQFKKEILKYKRENNHHHSIKPTRNHEVKNVSQHTYSVSPNQLRNSSNNVSQQIIQNSQMMPSLPRYLN